MDIVHPIFLSITNPFLNYLIEIYDEINKKE